jgi:hypothetical protein
MEIGICSVSHDHEMTTEGRYEQYKLHADAKLRNDIYCEHNIRVSC